VNISYGTLRKFYLKHKVKYRIPYVVYRNALRFRPRLDKERK
jgi:hypothetical protein